MDPISRVSASAVSGALRGVGLDGVGGARQVPVVAPEGSDPTSFGATLKRFVGEVSHQQDAASELSAKFLRGEPVELHQVMAAGEEASLSLELMIELRNKVTEAYRTLMAMQ